ncbi:MAG: hypothetical protein QOH63_1963 [Acidobacteriota bacterium]|jgi:hypothetical protein|nr:hypothetical protein [Acidobacteriota bacterium]
MSKAQLDPEQLQAILTAIQNASISVTVSPGDFEIGAAEIKDAATDTRVKVKTDGTDNALVVTQNTSPLPTGAATSAKQDTLISQLTALLAQTDGLEGFTDGIEALLSGGAAAGASRVNSSALEASHILKASPGTLISLMGYNSKGSAQFIQLLDSATLPADAAVPALVFTVPASSNFSVDVPITGLPFTAGIVVCNSSTAASKTIGSADCFFTGVIK